MNNSNRLLLNTTVYFFVYIFFIKKQKITRTYSERNDYFEKAI